MNTEVKAKPIVQQSLFVVPFYIVNLPGITLGYLKVYEVIFNFWYHKKPCYIGYKNLSERSQLGKTQVYEAINYFLDNGEIEIAKINGKKHFVQPIRILELENDDDFPVERKKFPVERKKVSAGAEHINNKLLEVNNTKDSCSSKNNEPNKEFERFWEAYPRKQSKKAALKIWKREKLTSKLELILSDLLKRKQTEWLDKQKQYIPHPSTYLNGERWNDEITPKLKPEFKSIPQRNETRCTVPEWGPGHPGWESIHGKR